jgi:hypothetical protein
MSDKMDNVISIDFGARRGEDESIRHLARPQLERAAKQRGYSPDRADELAALMEATVARMLAYSVNSTSLQLPTDLDDQTFASEVVKVVGKQVAQHCANEFARAVVNIADPVNR